MPSRLLGALPAALVGATVLYAYFPVLADLVAQWRSDENYSHGFLIPVLSAYLVWERRTQLRNCRTSVSVWGYGVLVLGALLLVVGQAATVGYAVRLSLLLVLAGLILLLAGPSVLRLVGFPLAYLLFMVPLPAPVLVRVAFPLQVLAARAATATLDVLNIPVLREGNIIDLVSTRLDVTEACSGVRSLVALLALAVIYAYFTQRTWGNRVILSLSALPIAVVTNAARVALTGILAQTVGVQMAMGFYHTFAGLLIFGLAFGLLAVEARALARWGFGVLRM